MQQNLLERAEKYALSYDYASLAHDDIRANSPVLFVILGDEMKESIGHIKQTMSRKLMNAEGVAYFYITQGQSLKQEQVISLSLPFEYTDEKTYRSTLSQRLLSDDESLTGLGEKVTQIKQAILGQSKLFKSWEQIYVSVIVSASDPISVLIPDLTVFLQKKLAEDFKQVFTDLFVIVDETSDTQIALKQATIMSLFKELDSYQSKDFKYSKPIEILPGNIKVDMTHDKELFDLVYILTDRQENGQQIKEAKKAHYETICAVNLLRNRYQKNIEAIEAKEQYNSALFIHNIQFNGEHRYASAKLAKVKKPGAGIYMAVAYHLYHAYMSEIAYKTSGGIDALLDLAGLSEGSLNRLGQSLLKGKERLSDIYSLMSSGIGFDKLKKVSFKEAEMMLYGKVCEAFFDINFTEIANNALQSADEKASLEKHLREHIINNAQYGPYAISELFIEDNHTKLEAIKQQVVMKQKQFEMSLKEKESELVGQKIGGVFSLFDKKYLREVKDYIINEVYDLKYKILQEMIKAKRIDCIKEILESLYESIQKDIKKLENVGEELRGLMEAASRFEEEYLVQNVNEYYQKVVMTRVERLKKTRGEKFFHDERFMGSVTELLSSTPENFLERLFEIEEKYILSDEELFNLSFENELLARSNIATTYENEEIVSKGDLYKVLYQSLEENSKPCIYLNTAQMGHRYEEKYFFADRASEFIAYAYERDKASRNYQLGCINDLRSSSIEKVQLVGGFKLSDLILTKAAARYYDVYSKEGYKFHG